jgi:hypothetical protein
MPICQFSIKFSLFKADIYFGKAQNTIRPFQYLLESNFFVRFENTSLTRSLQTISQYMHPQHCQPRTARYGKGLLPALGYRELKKLSPESFIQILEEAPHRTVGDRFFEISINDAITTSLKSVVCMVCQSQGRVA